jgi:hypothetical protein
MNEERRRVHVARTAVRELRTLLERRPWPPAAPLRAALTDTYRWGREAARLACDGNASDVFPSWRRAVHYHAHHVRLLAGRWPDDLAGRREALERLCKLLDEHDHLGALAESLRRAPARGALLALVLERQEALRAMARPLGRRLYGEPPAAFQRRLHLPSAPQRVPAQLDRAA